MGAAVARSSPEDLRTKVRLCGPLALKIDGRDALADLPAGQARSLLAYLLTRGERSAERGALIEVVWPSGAPNDSKAHLRVILTRLRRALAPATLEGRQQLRLALPAPVWVDVRETGHRLLMEALAATGNVAEALQVYDELRCLLRDELGVAPAAELQALHQRLLAGKSGTAPKVADRPVRQPVRRVVPAAVAAAPTRYARNGEISLA
jgi:DNA-binding SARP family transcriptional activator